MPTEPPQAKVFLTATTNSPPCSVLSHPTRPNLVVFGTYTLDQETRLRHGSLEFWARTADDGPDSPALVFLGQLDTPGSSVLDAKMFPSDPNVLLTAQSTGEVIVWRLEDLEAYYDTWVQTASAGPPAVLSKSPYSVTGNDASVLVLSLAISPVPPHTTISATLTSGAVVVCSLRLPDFTLAVTRRMGAAHGLEAWTSTFLYDSECVLFSGGDDAVLAAHDTRVWETLGGNSDDDDADCCTVWKSKVHDAGIVSILSLPVLSTEEDSDGGSGAGTYHLWTGGYDDMLKLVDLRVSPSMLQAMEHLPPIPPKLPAKHSMSLGDGVWKLVPSPKGRVSVNGSRARIVAEGTHGPRLAEANDCSTVLACCMYGGARVLRRNTGALLAGDGPPATVAKSLTAGHKSMVYGGVWLDNGDTALTCSFYDKAVQVWE